MLCAYRREGQVRVGSRLLVNPARQLSGAQRTSMFVTGTWANDADGKAVVSEWPAGVHANLVAQGRDRLLQVSRSTTLR